MKSLLSGDLSNMTSEELVSLYEKLCLDQDRAEDYFESARVYRIVHRRYQVLHEMRHRVVDERPALLPLYDHPHPRVRVNAAMETYVLSPQARERCSRLCSRPIILGAWMRGCPWTRSVTEGRLCRAIRTSG
jgi:hypothetical protein